MLLQELRAEFNEYFQGPLAQLVLWLDPTAQWKGIVPQLCNDFHVVEYRGSQLEVKATVEFAWAKKQRPRFVLYLPGLSRDRLNVLKEYEFCGKVFEESILQSLRRWGIEFDKKYEAELQKILPIALPHLATKGRTFWQTIRTPQNLRALLFDEETVRRVLASPESTVQELQKAETFEAFCDFLTEEYGGSHLRDAELGKWVVQFTAYLILTEVRVKTGRASNFPTFNLGWADERREAACLAFLRDWLGNTSYKDDFKRLSRQAEETYNLSAWASGLSEPPDAESSLKVELILERGVIGKINNLKSLQQLKDHVRNQVEVIERMATHFWSQEGDIVIWRALSLARKILESIDPAMSQLNHAKTAEALVDRYREEWWWIDRLYRSYRALYDGEDKLSKLSEQLRSVYREYLVALNGKFVDLFSQGSQILALEGIDSQEEFWNKAVGKKKKRRAVIFVDALRYELGMDLAERLKRDLAEANVSCEGLRGVLPSLTDLGMPALLPVEKLSVSVSDGRWDVRSGKESGNLASRAERKRFLKERYPKAVFFDLGDILGSASLELKDASLVVVFTDELDGSGHDSGVLNLSLDFFGQYLEGLARVVRRLGALGVEEIHLVSDHGFLLLDDLREADQVPVSERSEFAYLGHRCLVGHELPDDLGVVFDLPGSDSLRVAVPRGIGLFRTRGSKEFLHGGLSLHELLVPHLTITFKKAEPKYGARLRAPDAIRNLIFEVDVLRATPAEGGLFGSPRFLEILGYLMGGEKPREVFKEAGADKVIDQAHEVLKVRLRIKPGSRHRYGETLRLELKDADTGEQLDSAELRIEVESDE